MRFLSNAHTHTTYCDGLNTAADMLAEAKRLGFVSLGFSGHAYQGFDSPYCMAKDKQEAYFAELRAMQAHQAQEGNGPRLWVGLEQDAWVPPEEKALNRERCDYILGSTHYLCKDYRGKSVAVDGDAALLAAYVRDALDGDIMAMVRTYYGMHVQMLLNDRPDIIGHFDLVRKYAGPGPDALFDDTAAEYRRIALDALEAARPCGAVLEVNTGGMARGHQPWAYPSQELLGAWREMGGAVTLTSDCHSASLLAYGFDTVQAELKKLGYRELRRLSTGEVLWESVEV